MPAQTASMNIEVIPRIIKLDSSGGAFTEYLPPAALWRGQTLTFLKTTSDLTAITLDGFGSETINGVTTTTVNTQYEKLELFSDGTEIFIMQRYIPHKWTDYDPTLVGFGTPTNLNFEWMRVGSSIIIVGGFTSGTTTATEAQVPLPVGLTVSHGSHTTAIAVGTFGYNGNLAGSRLMIATSSDAFLNIAHVSSSANGLTERNGNDHGNTTAASVWAQCRIAGWPSI